MVVLLAVVMVEVIVVKLNDGFEAVLGFCFMANKQKDICTSRVTVATEKVNRIHS